MNYVENLDLLGVEAKEIPCIKGTNAPTSSTPGAVGMLYMTQGGALYKCISATNGVYLWDPVGEVLPTRGSSEKATMSQKVLTELFDKNDRDVANLQSEVAAAASKALRNDKRIANLEAGIPDDDFITDNSTAYVRDVPSNALPFAEITEIGGVTRKCAQLIPYPYADTTKTANGITFTVNDDRTITANGTAIDTIEFVLCRAFNFKNGVTYTLSGCPSGGGNSTYLIHSQASSAFDKGSGVTFTFDADKTYYMAICVYKGTTLNHVTFKPMLNIGETALPYEPFFEGLRSAKVTEVVSEGANLLNPDWRKTVTYEGVTFTKNADRSVTANGTATGDIFYSFADTSTSGNILKGGSSYYISLGNEFDWVMHKKIIAVGITKYGVTDYPVFSGEQAFTVPESYTSLAIRIRAYAGAVFDNETYYPMLAESPVAVPYRPYIRRTLAIPEAVRNLPDYGVGIPNTDYFNRIRWRYDEATDKWVREYDRPMKTTNLGTLNWQYGNLFGTDVYCFYAEGATDANNEGTYSIANMLCHLYDTTTANEIAQHGTTGIALYEKLIVICDTNYTDAASFKSAMSGVMLVYELATPEITDISHLLPEDNLIGVEGGGSMTPVNEFGYDVPMTVTYQI